MNTLVRTRRTQISPEPWATCFADERRADGQLGKKRDGCFAMVLELLRKGRVRGWEKFRLTSWKCLKRRTPTSVGTRALSVSHSKFSFPTSVSTVPLLYSPAPLPLAPFCVHPFSPLRGQVSGVELESSCGADAARTGFLVPSLFLGRESGVSARARHGSQHGAVESGPVRANLADQTGAKSRAFVRVNSIHELSIFPIFSPLRHFPSGAMLFLATSPSPLVPPSARMLLPRHPRPFQSMSSRQRAFRYF